MIAKCANPDCSKPFRYLHEGRLFVMSSSSKKSREIGRDSRVEYAWLCHDCAATLAVQFETGKGLRVVPLGSTAEARDPPLAGFLGSCLIRGGSERS